MVLFGLCPTSGPTSGPSGVKPAPAQRRGELSGRKCEFSKDKSIGGAALVTGIAMVIIAAILASGAMGAGKMYFIGAGLAVGSIIPFSLAAFMLKCKEAPHQTIGSAGNARDLQS